MVLSSIAGQHRVTDTRSSLLFETTIKLTNIYEDTVSIYSEQQITQEYGPWKKKNKWGELIICIKIALAFCIEQKADQKWGSSLMS